ncbi:MAG: GAF domain-containing protein [Proteobacteria bacterium]|nr:MAG: GAF domain-containing protein [Pseudomonadota bacterium]
MLNVLSRHASPMQKEKHYEEVYDQISGLLTADSDWVAAMATIVCELHGAFELYNWTGFYRVVRDDHLQIGPYQGGHGCLDIPFSKGVCGAAARTKKTQLVPDVELFEGHIACSSSTRSEVVVPFVNAQGEVLAVLDVDSDTESAFDEIDKNWLEKIAILYVTKYPQRPSVR